MAVRPLCIPSPVPGSRGTLAYAGASAGRPKGARARTVIFPSGQGIRFLLVSGKPIEKPVAWYGPIVMSTQEQLRQAMAELNAGSFIKHR
jgi:redox-sensitive bicupin YhaK (pirin superfamily)